MDDKGIKLYGEKIVSIFKAMGEPLPSVTDADYVSVMKKYTDKDGKINLPKMIRNATAYQVLVAMLDRIKDTIFTYQYLNGETKLESPQVSQSYLDLYCSHKLILLNVQNINSIINFLAYYFDIDTRDAGLCQGNIRNYLYIYDPEICIQLEDHILNKEFFAEIQDLFEQLINNCLLTPQITRLKNADTSNFTIRGIYSQHFTKEGTLKLCQDITKSLYELLEFLNKHILEKYLASQGFDSIHDRISKTDPGTGFFMDDSSEYIEKLENESPIKIYNLNLDIPSKIETDDFIIHKNRTFDDLKSRFHRSGTGEKFEISFDINTGTKAKRTVLPAQEGGLFWTHTLIFIDQNCNKTSKLAAGSTLSEDICLILSMLTGQSIYTEKSAIRYSHKSSLLASLGNSEIESALRKTLMKCGKMDEKDGVVLGLALEQYREAMQPMSANLRLIRIWGNY